MQVDYKKKILQEIYKIPDETLPNMYKIIHLLADELTTVTKKKGKRDSLKGIWKGSLIDDSLFTGKRKMPSFRDLSDDEVSKIIAFLNTI